MSRRSVKHDIISVERSYDARPERVFAFWADPRLLARWYTPGDDNWTVRVLEHEFSVGRFKRLEFGPRGEPPMLEDCRYEDIVPNSRICYAMTSRVLASA